MIYFFMKQTFHISVNTIFSLSKVSIVFNQTTKS